MFYREFAGIVHRIATVNKKLYIDILRRLGMRSKGNAPKNGEPTFGFTYTTMLRHTGRFGQGFLGKEQCDNAEVSPILSYPGCSSFLPLPMN
jgi:hypothetical protein